MVGKLNNRGKSGEIMTKDTKNRIQELNPKAKALLIEKIAAAFQTKNNEKNAGGQKKLVAYIQGKEGFEIELLKNSLKKQLPDYMVPASFVNVDVLPLLPNGKIDRKNLSKIKTTPQKTTPSQNTERKFINTTEQQLVTIWEEVLGFAPIKTTDNFFEIGGDSILSIQIVSKARKQGITLKANDIFEHQTIAELVLFYTPQNTITANDTKKEIQNKLITIWEEVLGFAPIKTTDNFFEIGGDSILSIQIISKARKEGIFIEPNHIFEHQTIAELSLFAKAAINLENNQIIEGEVPLSSIQHWFFENHKAAPQFWNQGIKVSNIPLHSKNQIEEICNHIISQHDVLRSIFIKKEGVWKSFILNPEQITAMEFVDISDINPEDYSNVITKKQVDVQANFNLSKGSLFKCIFFKTAHTNTNFCLLIAHHLVVDAISWKIIIDDFSAALQKKSNGEKLSMHSKTTSIIDWNNYLQEQIPEKFENEVDFWKKQIVHASNLKVDTHTESLLVEEKDIISNVISFSKEHTNTLVENANKAYKTKTEELIITALLNSIGTWNEQQEIILGLERHGRETAHTNLDLSETVGWFTTYFPLKFNINYNAEIGTKIIAVKETMRSIPNGGIGFGILRYEKNAFGSIGNPEIVFNFLGTQNTLNKPNEINVSALSKNLRSPLSERDYKFEINAMIKDEILICNWNYSSKMYHSQTIQNLANHFKQSLIDTILHCSSTKNEVYTPSDFDNVDISQDDLDNLLDLLE